MEKSPIRKWQDAKRDHGWRIAWIPHDDGLQTEWYPTNHLALVGALGFLGGLGFAFFAADPHNPRGAVIGIATALGSLLLMFFAVWRGARRKRAGWVDVTARCLDQEHRQVLGATTSRSWEARLLCEFDFGGQSYRATPLVHYRSFRTEAGLLKYLASRVSADGNCRLHINPANPLECELAGQGLKERLLHYDYSAHQTRTSDGGE